MDESGSARDGRVYVERGAPGLRSQFTCTCIRGQEGEGATKCTLRTYLVVRLRANAMYMYLASLLKDTNRGARFSEDIWLPLKGH